MTQAMTVEEATKALDDAIAKQKAAHKAAADMYGDVIEARKALDAALDAAFIAEDELMPQCTVSSVGILSSGAKLYKMVVLERGNDTVKCRSIGSRGGYITFRWRPEEQSYVAIRGVGGHRGIHRSIVSFDDEPLSGSENPGSAVTP